jgi:pyruvate dehydrogenase E1 component alpha subunit
MWPPSSCPEGLHGADPAKPHLTRDHLLALLRQMVRIRRFEEKCAELYQQEKIRGFLHLYIGEEAVAVGAMQALAPADAIVATYANTATLWRGACRWTR